LQLGALVADDRPILRPIELEGFARLERQGHKCTAAARLQFPLPILTLFPGEGRHAIVGPLIAEADQIGM
jgi:hypothetical protein